MIFVVRRRIFASGGTEAFLEGHVHAFTTLDGVPTGGQSDETGSVVREPSGGETTSYAEEKRNEARGELAGYAGVGLGALGIVLFISIAIATRRGNR